MIGPMTKARRTRVHGVDAQRWPDVAHPPHRPVHAAAARALFRAATSRVPVRVVTPDGHEHGGGGPVDPEMRLVRPKDFYARLGSTGLIGFGEAYMAGDWDAESEQLPTVLEAFARQVDRLVPRPLQRLRPLFLRRQPAEEDNTVEGARRNIARHYDLSNELFELFLDQSMTYSSALFELDAPLGDSSGASAGAAIERRNRAGAVLGASDADADAVQVATASQRLTDAQHGKIDRLLDECRVGPDAQVLEIGTGWGELAIRAAMRGARVTTVTISAEQATLARKRSADAGVGDRVDVQLRDYRQTAGEYDAVVSVEMIEAVGKDHWPAYFDTLDRRTRPGGRVGLQAILMPDDRMRAMGDTYTWIRKYIFPGGQIASLESIRESVRAGTSLVETGVRTFGTHYAETLRRWRQRFEQRAAEVERLGFDRTFRRMWSLYLAYSEAGFRAGYLDVGQFTFEKAAPA